MHVGEVRIGPLVESLAFDLLANQNEELSGPDLTFRLLERHFLKDTRREYVSGPVGRVVRARPCLDDVPSGGVLKLVAETSRCDTCATLPAVPRAWIERRRT